MESHPPPPPPTPPPLSVTPPPVPSAATPPNPYQLGGPIQATVAECPPPIATGPRPWGFWFTVLWSAICAVLFVLAQTAVAVVVLIGQMARTPGGNMVELAESLEHNGLVLALSTVASTIVSVGFLTFIVWVRGLPVADYLGLRRVGIGTAIVSMLLMLLLAGATDGLTWLLDKPIVPPFMEGIWNTAGWSLPVLLLAILVLAPISEELFFRGFLFRGLAASWMRPVGAIVVTALCFAVIHLQYDWYGIATVFVGGLFLGTVRWRTGSTALTILLHALMNLVATVETALKFGIPGVG